MPPPRAAKISVPRFSVPTDTEDFRAQTRDLCLMHDVFMRACFQHSLLCVQVVLRVILRKDLRITKVTARSAGAAFRRYAESGVFCIILLFYFCRNSGAISKGQYLLAFTNSGIFTSEKIKIIRQKHHPSRPWSSVTSSR